MQQMMPKAPIALLVDHYCASVPRMLDDFSHELDSTHSRLDNVMKKLAKVSHMTSGRSRGWALGLERGRHICEL